MHINIFRYQGTLGFGPHSDYVTFNFTCNHLIGSTTNAGSWVLVCTTPLLSQSLNKTTQKIPDLLLQTDTVGSVSEPDSFVKIELLLVLLKFS